MKVLIVDDNAQARRMIRRCLGEYSNDFRECEDGAEALTAYREFLPDWVLMDWEMKRMHGLAAAQLILAAFPAARILIVTNYDEKNLRRAAVAAGAKGFVSKDNLFDLSQFITNPQLDGRKSGKSGESGESGKS